tara:strand:- start:2921 stop:3292 length:372 start_codon:yes stop_codon:yes gene_type:complete
MSHALIIEQNMVVGSELSKRLSDLGFDSFDHVWTEDDAVAIAEMRPPDLILVGDRLETGDAVGAARRICEKHDVPVLMVTADSVRARQRLMDGAVIDGPFAFSKFPEALEAAKGPAARLATVW